MAEKETILGVEVSSGTYESITNRLFEGIKHNQQAFIVAVNPEKIMKAVKDESLRSLINSADYQIPDGVGILIASKLQGGKISNRITGIDLMAALLEKAARLDKKVFFYGGKPGVAEAAKNKVLENYPELKVAGILDGYIKDNDTIIDTINQADPDILFVALGSPRQEEWIRSNREKLNVSVFQGVGGSFDVLAGNINRAPAVFRKFGLEWLYRLLIEPSRWKRQLALPKFLVKVIKSK